MRRRLATLVLWAAAAAAAQLGEERLEASVQEGAAPATELARLTLKPGYQYRLNEASPWFSFDPVTGVIRTRGILDRESLANPQLDLLILATSSGGPAYFVTVAIQVVDVNDNAPSFPLTVQNLSIPESARVGSRLALASALDPDEGDNGVVAAFRINDGNSDGRFRLARGGQAGAFELELAAELDREEKRLYILNVSAEDGGRPPLSGHLTVFVHVLDANDNAPLFQQSHYSVSVAETLEEGAPVLQVTASDADDALNAALIYYISNDAGNQFAVDATSGVISSRVPRLTCPESCSEGNCSRLCVFTVEAVDEGTPAQRGRAFVNVVLEDENDHAPRLLFRTYPQGSSVASVEESAAPGSVVAVVTTVDDDAGDNGRTSLSIAKGNDLGFFRLDSNQLFSLIRLAKPLNAAQVTRFNLTITASDSGTPPKSTTDFLPIFVRGEDEKPPTFTNSSYSATISEDSPIGSFVASLAASSPATSDRLLAPNIRYNLTGGNERGWFHLSPTTGLLTTAAQLDFETTQSVTLHISAKDANSNLGSTQTSVAVRLLDVNDQAPIFRQPLLRVSIAEEEAAGGRVARVAASDADSGAAGAVTFSWAPGSETQDHFSLHANTGVVTLLRSLDRERRLLWNLTILATDAGRPALSSQAQLLVDVVDSNGHRPHFYPSQQFVSISPHTERIATCGATDGDSGSFAELQYSLLDPQPRQFSVDAESGLVKATGVLNEGQYVVAVTALDGGGQEAANNCTVVVFVADAPVFKPIFARLDYAFSVLEDSASSGSLGRPVGSLTATDPDASSQVEYEITRGDPESVFSIGRYSGEIRSVQALDREARATFDLEVTAVGKRSFSIAPVVLTILDANDNTPKFLSPLIRSGVADVALSRDAPAGATVFQATATDPDEGANGRLSYAFASDSPEFHLDTSSGFVTLIRPAALLAQPAYSLQLAATDAGDPPRSAFLTLRVQLGGLRPSPDAPRDFVRTIFVSEAAALNARLEQLAYANTGDRRLLFRPELVEPTAPFGVFPDGWLYVRNALDFEQRATAELVVIGSLDGDDALRMRVAFVVLDENDRRPECAQQTTTLRLRENQPPFTSIGFLGAEDADSGLNGRIRFSLGSTSDLLRLDFFSGELRALKSFDRETMGASSILADARLVDLGKGGEQDVTTCKLEVVIDDENDSAPVFTLDLYSGSVLENDVPESPILTLTATDEDEEPEIHYSIVAGNEDAHFRLDADTGELHLASTLDREQRSEFKLQVEASDGVFSTSAVAVVAVLDANDNAPAFRRFPAQGLNVSERAPVGTLLAHFEATDGDLGDAGRLSYRIASGNLGGAFQLDPHSGRLRLAKSLDAESVPSYTLSVAATDGGSPPRSAATPLLIVVDDANDHAPELIEGSTHGAVSEDAPVGALVMQLRARDADSGKAGQVRFELLGQLPSAAFRLDPDTGVLSTAAALDRETVAEYRLRVRLTDRAEVVAERLSSETVVHITIADVNDQPPRFVGPHAAAVEMAAPPGLQLALLRAVDGDLGLNASVGFLLDGDVGGRFGLSPDGALYLQSALPADGPSTYALDIQAVDRMEVQGRPSAGLYGQRLSTRIRYTVLLTADRDSRLRFERPTYSFDLSEDAVIGADVGQVSAPSASGVAYYITRARDAQGADAADCPVDVETRSGRIRVARRVDREALGNSLHLDIYAVGETGSALTKVNLNLIDVNDEPPIPSQEEFQFAVLESAIEGTLVGQLGASDPDLIGSLAYRIADPGPFQVDAKSGELRLIGRLDRETQPEFRLSAQISDGPNTVAVPVHITVADINDEAPRFPDAPLQFSVGEDARVGAFVGRLSASDADEGPGGEVRFGLLDPLSQFHLDPESGILTLNEPLDHETDPLFSLLVEASDRGRPELRNRTLVRVIVEDRNDNPPRFEPRDYAVTVGEAADVGSQLIQLGATDPDSDAWLSYAVTGGDPWDEFEVTSNGTLRLAKALDRETRPSYQLTITVWDQAQLNTANTATAMVRVSVEDVNDVAPIVVGPASLFIAYDTGVGAAIAELSARDPDVGLGGDVELRLDPRHADLFSLDPLKGTLRRKAGLLQRELYVLSVTADDRGSPSLQSTKDITVHVLPPAESSEKATFIMSKYALELAEDTAVGKSILQLSVTGSSSLFWVANGDPSQQFAVSTETGVLSLRRPLDFEEEQSFRLSIAIGSAAGKERTPSDTAIVEVTVTDKNDNAPFFPVSPLRLRVVESVVASTTAPITIGQASALDPDKGLNANLSYSIVQGNTSLFVVDAMSGELKLIGYLDRETRDNYQLILQATDAGVPRLSGSTSVFVVVEDANDERPRFPQPYYATRVAEGPRPSRLVATVAATDGDQDAFGTLSYSIASADGQPSIPFTIDPHTGVVETIGELDREAQSSWRLVVTARDGAPYLPLSTSVQLRVSVQDVNDNPPRITTPRRQLYVPDSLGIGSTVFVVAAEDPDGGSLTFSLGRESDSEFAIGEEDGRITARGPLSYRDRYSVVVVVRDSELSVSAAFSFFTAPAAQFPLFSGGGSLASVRVSEGVGGLEVARLSAASPKPAPFNRLRFELAAGNHGHAFEIEPSTGRITTTERLDRERTPVYTLWVQASDSDQPSLSTLTSVRVTVSDANDNAPEFQSPVYYAVVSENQFPPATVMGLTATDADIGENARISYGFVAGNDEERFTIDESSGVVQTKESLDREQSHEYRLTVAATDGGSPPRNATALLMVSVGDENDNSPKFTRLFTARVSEDASIGTFVTQVTSADPDSPEFSNNTYYLSTNPGRAFAIDPYSGNVSVAAALDREAAAEFALKVVAVDGSWRVETSLTVRVDDVNDNAPLFDQPIFSFSVSSGQPALSSVGRVGATDGDEAASPNSAVSFRLMAKSELFSLDAHDGLLVTLKELRYSSSARENTHEIIVSAADAGRPQLQTSAKIIVRVTEQNNFAPIFPRDRFEVAVTEDAPLGATIFTASAWDEDEGPNGEVSYSLSGAPEALRLFSVDDEGRLVTRTQMGPTDTAYALRLAATDGGNPPISTSAALNIRVTPANSNAPEFASEVFEATVSELAPIGKAILQFTAKDVDDGLNGQLSFALAPSAGSGAAVPVSVDPESGIVSVNASLGGLSAISAVVSVRDAGFPPKSAEARLALRVMDENNHSPKFASQRIRASVLENSAPGTLVATLTATDEDGPPHDVVRYAIVDGNSEAVFALDAESGLLSVAGRLDFEERTEWRLTVRASNPGTQLGHTAVVVVSVGSVDEFAPSLSSSSVSLVVEDSAPGGTLVGAPLEASDRDGGPDGRVEWALDQRGRALGFAIQPRTGQLRTSGSHDGATGTVSFAAYARGRGDNLAVANVTVAFDKGGVWPAFLQTRYTATLKEDAPRGTRVLQVSAKDQSGKTSVQGLRYSLRSPAGPFSIDSATGVLIVSGTPDFETQTSFSLTAEAESSGRLATALLVISIEDVNDNAPQLPESNRIGRVLEDEPVGTSVMMLRPVDLDLGTTSFTMELVGGPGSEHFRLHASTGLLSTADILNREQDHEYRLQVRITDDGTPPRSSVEELLIIVDDINDMPSEPTDLSLRVAFDDPLITGDLGSVHPMDPDLVGDYDCDLPTSASSFFFREGCHLFAQKLSSATTQRLSLNGSDGRHPPVAYGLALEFFRIAPGQLEAGIIVHLEEETSSKDADLQSGFIGPLKNMLKMSGASASLLSVWNSSRVLVSVSRLNAASSFLSGREALALLASLASRGGSRVGRFRIAELEWDGCTDEPCLNEGSCSSSTIGDFAQREITRSGSRLLSLPAVSRTLTCTCGAHFTGQFCERRLDRCKPNPCHNNGRCSLDSEGKAVCGCGEGWTGAHCETDVDECASAPCAHDGYCENSPGAFKCICLLGFGGRNCERRLDHCSPSPCLNGGTCSGSKERFTCTCPFGISGERCEVAAFGMDEETSLRLPPLHPSKNHISLEFATTMKSLVLLHSFGSGGSYAAVDVLASGRVRLSAAIEGHGRFSLALEPRVDSGRWLRLTLLHQFQTVSISLGECSSDGRVCEACSPGNESCSATAALSQEALLLPGPAVWLGGSRSMSELSARPGQVSGTAFVGCIRNLRYNEKRLADLVPAGALGPCRRTAGGPCASPVSACGQSASGCADRWAGPECVCKAFTSRRSCDADIEGTSFQGGFLRLTMLDSYRLKQTYRPVDSNSVTDTSAQFFPRAESRPKRRIEEGHRLRLHFRSSRPEGLLFFAASGQNFSLLDLWNGTLRYLSKVGGAAPVRLLLDAGGLGDGAWHSLYFALSHSGRQAELRVDGEGRIASAADQPLHDFLGPDLSLLSVAGLRSQDESPRHLLKVYGVHVPEFHGCLQYLVLDGEAQPLGAGRSSKFSSSVVGSVTRGCAGPPSCPSPPCVGGVGSGGLSTLHSLLIVGAFFGLLFLLVGAVWCVLKRRRRKAAARSSCASSTRLGDIAIIANKDILVHHPGVPSYDQRATLKSSDLDLSGSQNNLLGSRRIVEASPSNIGSPPPFYNLTTPTAAGYHHQLRQRTDENPDRYDLDNASSIAPSDIDAAPHHYHGYRGGSVAQLKASLRGSPEDGTDATSLRTATSGHSSRRSRKRTGDRVGSASRSGGRSRRRSGDSGGETLANLRDPGRRFHANPSFQGESSSSEPSPEPRRRRPPALRHSSSDDGEGPRDSDLDLSRHRRSRLPPDALGLDRHRPPRRRPEEESESESESAGVPQSLAPFRAPRSMFPVSEDDSPPMSPHGKKPSPRKKPPNEDNDLEAYV